MVCSASRTDRLNSRVRVSDIHWTGDYLGPRPNVDALEKIQISLHCREPKHFHLVSQSLYRLIYSRHRWWKGGGLSSIGTAAEEGKRKLAREI